MRYEHRFTQFPPWLSFWNWLPCDLSLRSKSNSASKFLESVLPLYQVGSWSVKWVSNHLELKFSRYNFGNQTPIKLKVDRSNSIQIIWNHDFPGTSLVRWTPYAGKRQMSGNTYSGQRKRKTRYLLDLLGFSLLLRLRPSKNNEKSETMRLLIRLKAEKKKCWYNFDFTS